MAPFCESAQNASIISYSIQENQRLIFIGQRLRPQLKSRDSAVILDRTAEPVTPHLAGVCPGRGPEGGGPPEVPELPAEAVSSPVQGAALGGHPVVTSHPVLRWVLRQTQNSKTESFEDFIGHNLTSRSGSKGVALHSFLLMSKGSL